MGSSHSRPELTTSQRRGSDFLIPPPGSRSEEALAAARQREDPCYWEETFFKDCRAHGHSTIRCLKAQGPNNITKHQCQRRPDGPVQSTKTSTDFPLCPRCDDIDQMVRFGSNKEAWRLVDGPGYGFRRARYRDPYEWIVNRRQRLIDHFGGLPAKFMEEEEEWGRWWARAEATHRG